MNRTVIISVSIIAISATICFIVSVMGNRYTAISAGGGAIYRVDRRTGKTVVIHGTRETLVKQDAPDDLEQRTRDLTSAEISRLTGRAGLSFASYFSGNLHNGNEDILVTELEVTVTTTISGQQVSRPYRSNVSIRPQTKRRLRSERNRR